MSTLDVVLGQIASDAISYSIHKQESSPRSYYRIIAEQIIWSVYRKGHIDLLQFYAWKADPIQHRQKTEEMADQMVELIHRWQPILPKDWIVTTPPQGASIYHTKDQVYPAGFLAKNVAVRLGLDFVKTITRSDVKRYHFPSAALKQKPFKMLVKPPSIALIVDDMITSGVTMQLTLEIFRQANVPAYGFVWIGGT